MKQTLPELDMDELAPTRDYLQAVALSLSSLQRAFLPKHPRDWQYGLEVNMRGLVTQPFKVDGEEIRASLDLVKYKVRLGEAAWSLHEYSPPEIFKNLKVWLAGRGVKAELEEPDFKPGVAQFDTAQADAYAEALWWLDKQFRDIKGSLHSGVTAPILLYPHHFDLSLVWFPHDDDKQLAAGWSTGDETVKQPYIYVTAYPEPDDFSQTMMTKEAYWQKDGFSGAVLLYSDVVKHDHPEELLQSHIMGLFVRASFI